MRLVSFNPEHPITHFDSQGATITGVAQCSGDVRVSLLRLDVGGIVGEHPATSTQVFLVVAGSGWVRSRNEERRPIEAGRAAVWDAGEAHESGSDVGLTAVVIEAETLEPL